MHSPDLCFESLCFRTIRQSGDRQGTGALSDTSHHWGFGFIESVDIKLLVQCLLSFNICHLIFSLPYNKLNKYCRISLQSSIPGNSQCINVLFSKNLLDTSKDPSSFENFKKEDRQGLNCNYKANPKEKSTPFPHTREVSLNESKEVEYSCPQSLWHKVLTHMYFSPQ